MPNTISVVIPTFNRATIVPDAIDSALSQSLPPLEVIVVDDGSSDQTRETLHSRYGDRIRYLHQPNGGVSSARNTGIRAARGDWIAFLDSDDQWLPSKLESQLRHTRARNDLVAVVSDCEIVLDDSESIRFFDFQNCPELKSADTDLNRPLRYVLKAAFATPTYMVRRSALENALFDQTMSIGEDMEFFSRLSLKGPFAVCADPTVRVYQRQSGQANLSAQTVRSPSVFRANFVRIAEMLLARPDLTPEDRRTVRGMLSNNRFLLALAQWTDGNRPEARRTLLRSFKDSPTPKSALKSSLVLALGSTGLRLAGLLARRHAKSFRREDWLGGTPDA